MIAVGEEANNLENVLIGVADNLEKRTSRRIDTGVRLLEPVLLLVMATIVTFVIVALLVPALVKLGALDARQARVVELRFFGGLDVEQTAETLGISVSTVKRDWTFARAFLWRELEDAAET